MALNKSTIRQQCQVCFAEGPTIIDPSSTRGTNTTINTSGGANEPYQPQVPRQAAAGQLPHNLLMAGRRRRTAAAALRWPRCQYIYRSSNRSTCAEIECHSSPPRSTRRRPRDRLCSMAWRVTTVRTTTQDNLRLTGRVPHRRSQIAAADVRVRVEFNFGRLVAVVVGSAQSSARPCEHVHHRCARDDASTHR